MYKKTPNDLFQEIKMYNKNLETHLPNFETTDEDLFLVRTVYLDKEILNLRPGFRNNRIRCAIPGCDYFLVNKDLSITTFTRHGKDSRGLRGPPTHVWWQPQDYEITRKQLTELKLSQQLQPQHGVYWRDTEDLESAAYNKRDIILESNMVAIFNQALPQELIVQITYHLIASLD